MASIISAGTSTGTALNLTGDTSGILSLASNNGTVALTVDASQNVGIGTSSPTQALQIGSTSKASDSIVYAASASGAYKTGFVYEGSGGSYGFIGYNKTGSTYLGIPTSAVGFSQGGAATPMVFATDATERMRIDSSGNVGIGTSSPSTYGKLALAGNSSSTPITFGIENSGVGTNGGGTKINFSYAGTVVGYILNQFDGGDFNTIIQGNQQLRFLTGGSGGTERMRINSGGGFLVGKTAESLSTSGFGVDIVSGGLNGVSIVKSYAGYGTALWINRLTSVGTGSLIEFAYNSTTVGTVTTNGTTTSYNVTSDRRLKENILPFTNGLSSIIALKPSQYNYISDKEVTYQGFIADELQAVVPQAVTGEADGVDAEGKPVYQGVDSSFLIPHLVSAIQEQQALIENLTTRLAALEGAK